MCCRSKVTIITSLGSPHADNLMSGGLEGHYGGITGIGINPLAQEYVLDSRMHIHSDSNV